MKVIKVLISGFSIMAVALAVHAGDGFGMKCKAKACGYEAQVTFGGGMVYEQLTGYCRGCRKFVSLRWTRAGSPALSPAAKIVPPPKPLGEVWDAKTGRVLAVYACPHCKAPFAEIKSKDDLKRCPACDNPEFTVDDAKPRMAID